MADRIIARRGGRKEVMEGNSGAGFSLLLFSTDAAFIRDAVEAGVHGIVVDWENQGKILRQRSADTQVNFDTVEDLIRVRQATSATVVCRIQPHHARVGQEIEAAIAGGADEILLPMVRTVHEVEAALTQAAGRVGVGILVETRDAVRIAADLGHLPLTRAYMGLNDLMIDRGAAHIFQAIADGTVERVRGCFEVPFGFGGLTLPDRGAPIPCRLLIAEMARLGCDFSFLRRSFLADVRGRDVRMEVPRVLQAMSDARSRPAAQIARDHEDLCTASRALTMSLGVGA